MSSSDVDRADRELGLGGLVVWLAIFGVALGGLEQLAGWPAQPPLPDHLPSWNAVQVWLNSPPADIGPLLPLAFDIGWLVWALTAASVVLQVVVDLLDAFTRGAAWVRSLRDATSWLVAPPIRRAVDASLGGLLLARVLVQPAAALEAGGVPMASMVSLAPADWRPPEHFDGMKVPLGAVHSEVAAFWSDDRQPTALADSTEELIYAVQPGDTLWALGGQFYGDPQKGAETIFEANQGRQQPDGRAFNRRGLIFVGWTLRIPNPTRCIQRAADGTWWYTVKPGDTLDGISARLLGDPNRGLEIFELNRGARTPDGHVLTDPNVIWPELGLQVPLESALAVPTAAQAPVESAPTTPPAAPPLIAVEPDQVDRGTAQRAVTPSVQPTVSPTTTPTSAPTPVVPEDVSVPVHAAPAIEAPPSVQPVEQTPPDSSHRLSPTEAALGAAGLAAAALAASRLIIYKRKSGRDPDGPESEVLIQDGFADVDPVENLARRVARTSDPASAIASLLGQAYAAIFDEALQPDERREIHDVTVAAIRHGRSSTTLVLAAPVGARPYFVYHMRAAAERAFGDQVDVDGKVDLDGDVLVRVTWDLRNPIAGDLLEQVNDSNARCAWPAPCLVPALDLYDRQRVALNWHTLSGMLVAAPTGQGADAPLVALVAALASVRAPADLGLVVVARPHTLPDEIGLLAHGLLEVVDPGCSEAAQRALEGVKIEIDRRRQAGSAGDADVVVVVRELGDLEPAALAMCADIAGTGQQYAVRLIAASERPVAELLLNCPFIDRLGTRLVLQTASEEDSVALLGMPGAERLGAGGHALLRFEGRMPHPGWAHRVSADRLAGLLHMMGTRAPTVPAAAGEHVGAQPAEAVDDSRESHEPPVGALEEAAAGDVEEPAAAASSTAVVENDRARVPGVPPWASRLLRELRAAPIRVRCFGACDVQHGDRPLKIGDPELLLLLAVHPVAGITNETVADLLWDEDDMPPDPAGSVRKERSKLRLTLRRLVPDLPADPLPGNAYHGEKVVTLDTALVASDVHEFVELLDLARGLGRSEAIEAYEAALALYRGDLLDASDMRKYRWMYDADPQIALGRRAELRGLHKAARLKLAGLLAEGPESGWARAEQLYSDLCGEDLDNEHLWTALFRIYERTSNSLGLESAVRRFRDALVELGTTDASDIDRVPLPPNLERLARQIRQRIGGVTSELPGGGD